MYDTDGWADTKEVIVGLYPKWNLTSEQASAFRDEFQPLYQEALREAVRRLWLEDKFGSGTLNPGRLKAMYGRVRSEREAAHRSADPDPGDTLDYEDIRRSHENMLRRVLMSPVAAVNSAADIIRKGIGRWGWIRPKRNEGNDPTKWSDMMRSAVMYEIENPSTEAGDATDSTVSGGLLSTAERLVDSGSGRRPNREEP